MRAALDRREGAAGRVEVEVEGGATREVKRAHEAQRAHVARGVPSGHGRRHLG